MEVFATPYLPVLNLFYFYFLFFLNVSGNGKERQNSEVLREAPQEIFSKPIIFDQRPQLPTLANKKWLQFL